MTPPLMLLLADTTRSQGYVQALSAAGVTATSALVVRSPDDLRWGQTSARPTWDRPYDLPIPDLSIALLDTLPHVAPSIEVSDQGTLNGSDVRAWRSQHPDGLVVFSGFGGELVGADVLDAGAPMLHVHSGRLPQYRGSTTMYYSLLAGEGCSVTAILLEEEIDAGPIVGRRDHPPPPRGMDLDHLHDTAMRSDLLVTVVTRWLEAGGSFPQLEAQGHGGTTYYIIHPVLKHIAIGNL